MNDEQIEGAEKALSWMFEQARSLESAEGVLMQGQLAIAQTYLVEYRAHLAAGMTQQEAIAATARGELKVA